MIVTVMSDASFCHRTRAAGWGVWVKSNRGGFEAGGNFKNSPVKASDAEAMALGIALYAAFKAGLAQKGDKIILQTDCMYVIQALQGTWNDSSRRLKKYADYINSLARAKGCEIEVRHVKAHAPDIAARNYINEVCDQNAKKYMRAQRIQLRAA